MFFGNISRTLLKNLDLNFKAVLRVTFVLRVEKLGYVKGKRCVLRNKNCVTKKIARRR